MSDLIDRQAAIDVVTKHYRAFDNDLLELIAYELGQLPSAQPEPCEDAVSRRRLLSDLKELTAAWEKYPVMAEQIKGVETAIGYVETIPSAQPEQRWIPCDKGEPDEDMECWVTVKTTDALYRGNFTKRYGERRDKGFITSGGFMWWNTALAWMPIYEPEPYRTEGDDNHE